MGYSRIELPLLPSGVRSALCPSQDSILLSFSTSTRSVFPPRATVLMLLSLSGGQFRTRYSATLPAGTPVIGIGPMVTSPAAGVPAVAFLYCYLNNTSTAFGLVPMRLDTGVALWTVPMLSAFKVVAWDKDALLVWQYDAQELRALSWQGGLLWRSAYQCVQCSYVAVNGRRVTFWMVTGVQLQFGDSFARPPLTTALLSLTLGTFDVADPDGNTFAGYGAAGSAQTGVSAAAAGSDSLWQQVLLPVNGGSFAKSAVSSAGSLWVIGYDADPNYFVHWDSPLALWVLGDAGRCSAAQPSQQLFTPVFIVALLLTAINAVVSIAFAAMGYKKVRSAYICSMLEFSFVS